MSVEISGLICLWGCSSFSCLLYIQIWDSQKQSPPQYAGMRRGRGRRCVCGQRRACQPCLHDRAASTTSSCAFGGEWRPAPHRQEAPSQWSSEVGDRWRAVKHKGGWSGYRAPDAENQAAGSLENPPANLDTFLFGLTLTLPIASCWASPTAQQYRIFLQWRRRRLDPPVGKIPWRRKWQRTSVFLPGKSHGQRGAWWATVHRVTKNQTRLSTHT